MNLIATQRGTGGVRFTKEAHESVADAARAAGVSQQGIVIIESIAGEAPRYGGKLDDGLLVSWGTRPWG